MKSTMAETKNGNENNDTKMDDVSNENNNDIIKENKYKHEISIKIGNKKWAEMIKNIQ